MSRALSTLNILTVFCLAACGGRQKEGEQDIKAKTEASPVLNPAKTETSPVLNPGREEMDAIPEVRVLGRTIMADSGYVLPVEAPEGYTYMGPCSVSRSIQLEGSTEWTGILFAPVPTLNGHYEDGVLKEGRNPNPGCDTFGSYSLKNASLVIPREVWIREEPMVKPGSDMKIPSFRKVSYKAMRYEFRIFAKGSSEPKTFVHVETDQH